MTTISDVLNGLDQAIAFPKKFYFIVNEQSDALWSNVYVFSSIIIFELFCLMALIFFVSLSRSIFKFLEAQKLFGHLANLDGFAHIPALGSYTVFRVILCSPLLLFGLSYWNMDTLISAQHFYAHVFTFILSILCLYLWPIVLIEQVYFYFFRKGG